MPYVALIGLKQPDTLIYGYQPGDTVPDAVIQNWSLTDGREVAWYADGQPAPTVEDVGEPERPGPEGTRQAWERWALANGMHPDQVAEVPIEELQEFEPETRDVDAQERPRETAPKASWVDYVIAAGGDESWASARDTSKADLIAWAPERRDATPAGDPVALSATDQLVEGRE